MTHCTSMIVSRFMSNTLSYKHTTALKMLWLIPAPCPSSATHPVITTLTNVNLSATPLTE